MKIIEFNIEGMKCEGCVNRIKNVLAEMKEIESYDVSLETKKLSLSIKKEKIIDEVIRKIQNLGFEISKI